ncbi:MAG: YkgJ family cysteine cluster protein [Candidatus Omnitrophica bacterium]|nr:YkgJ family cysteine cluster protein [Candidatus Omnitrophota bacterium]MCB9720103.1 YkgJ family cysteine cluster protein [Candidatus Omnitrophota bacterium]
MTITDNLLALWRNIRLLISARLLPPKFWRPALQLAAFYQTVDRRLAGLRAASGIRCAPGCGRCCENVYAETSVLEMLPLAAVLVRRRRVDLWLNALRRRPAEGRCIFYRRSLAGDGRGRCTIYVLRPLICRLFGFAAKRRRGGGEVITCRVIRTAYPVQLKTANHLVNEGTAGIFADQARAGLTRIDESLARRLGPLPQTLYQAITLIGLWRQMHRHQRTRCKAGFGGDL